MKQRFTASIDISEWQTHFFSKGIQAGEVEGRANCNADDEEDKLEEEAILCQISTIPFHLTNGRFLVVEFEKDLREVYVDYQAGPPEVPHDYPKSLPWGHKTYQHLKIGKLPKGVSWFGSYVKKIRPTEIIKVSCVIGVESARIGLRMVYEGKYHPAYEPK